MEKIAHLGPCAVYHNEEHTQYTIEVDSQRAGLAQYVNGEGKRTFTHTETNPNFRGQGLAQYLVSNALIDTADKGLSIVPVCPYVVKYVAEHPSFAENND